MPSTIIFIRVACGAGHLGTAVAPCAVQQVQYTADGQTGGNNADQLADLLLDRGRTQQVAGLQVLRGIRSNGSADADDRGDGHGADHALDADVAGGLQDHGRDQQGGNGHAGDRVVGAADHADHTCRDGGEEEAEDDDQQSTQRADGDGRSQPDDEDDEQDAAQNKGHGHVLIGTGGAGSAAALHALHGVAEGGYDQRQALDQRNDTAGSNGACADILDVVGPDGVCTACCIQISNGGAGCCRVQGNVCAEQADQRDNDHPAYQRTGKHIGSGLGADDIAHAQQ